MYNLQAYVTPNIIKKRPSVVFHPCHITINVNRNIDSLANAPNDSNRTLKFIQTYLVLLPTSIQGATYC